MRKIFLFLVVVLLSVSISGCTKQEEAVSTQILTVGKQYIRGSEDDKAFFIFYKDGTGKYGRYNVWHSDESNSSDFEIAFKYLIIEDTAVCFYDSVAYGEQHGQFASKVQTSWTMVVGFSKNVLISTSGTVYVCEDYLPNIPNFNS